MSNIALGLCLEVARYYSLDSVNAMRYSDATLKFWKMGYKLMQEQFILFMSGMKGTGTITVEGKCARGHIDPHSTAVNFIVPSLSVLRSYESDKFPTCVQPGIIATAIECKAKQNKDFILTVDGKKVAQGLTAPNFTMLPVRRTKRNAHGWSTGVHLGLVQFVSYSLVGNPNSRVVLQPDLHPVGSDAGLSSGH